MGNGNDKFSQAALLRDNASITTIAAIDRRRLASVHSPVDGSWARYITAAQALCVLDLSLRSELVELFSFRSWARWFRRSRSHVTRCLRCWTTLTAPPFLLSIPMLQYSRGCCCHSLSTIYSPPRTFLLSPPRTW